MSTLRSFALTASDWLAHALRSPVASPTRALRRPQRSVDATTLDEVQRNPHLARDIGVEPLTRPGRRTLLEGLRTRHLI